MSSTQTHHIPAHPGTIAGTAPMLDDAIYARLPIIGVLPVARPTRRRNIHF